MLLLSLKSNEMEIELVNQIKSHFKPKVDSHPKGEYFNLGEDLPNIRFEVDTFYLVVDSTEGFTVMTPLNINSLEDILFLYKILGYERRGL